MAKVKKRKRTKASRPCHSLEIAAKSIGFRAVAGVDEAGRGPLAGPVVAAAVVLPVEAKHLDINDSKKISPKKREKLYSEIIEMAVSWKIVSLGVPAIDSLNIYRAALHAMKEAVTGLEIPADFVYVDGPKTLDIDIPQAAVKSGDAVCFSIAAASILAKVSRDRCMLEYEEIYPGYGFCSHKGYGTKAHLEALEALGPCPIHRRSFGPVKRIRGE